MRVDFVGVDLLGVDFVGVDLMALNLLVLLLVTYSTSSHTSTQKLTLVTSHYGFPGLRSVTST